ncbi:aromatic amino acid transaminase [Limoniibacter endophyticus]|uniref:Aminotransferase n=1 Tax=Limoniibacter endophyticus TaxID=1565040 RepID=A0A8J3DHU0_9HYPH|nr:amino acid aminotransferase [Limoniibacter endophyticus]GHC69164.1 aminotransferase [Limoniibacter endophyticus]
MFENLVMPAPDAILSLMASYRADPRTDKIDLGVGVYKDETGKTPVMRAVREAEKRLAAHQDTKTYLGLAGDVAFNAAMIDLVFGPNADKARLRAVQTPGGSGALRLLADLLNRAKPGATVWHSDPTWPNHIPILQSAQLKTQAYPYFDATTGSVRFEAMIEALMSANAGDIVLLHGCCHNPTGANLTIAQWTALADLLVEKNLFPFIDLAYQGFGDGLEEDAAGLRIVAGKVPELCVAASCSKNFGVYRDRVGAAIIMARDEAAATIAFTQMGAVARVLYSMPPDHGAAVVGIILTDADLSRIWREELDETRQRMLRLRTGLADELRKQSNSDRFDFIAEHRGMFSRLGLEKAQVERLREEHGIYIVGDSRFNVAGLPEGRLDVLAKAIVSVL